ncbi:MAG: primosomal protein N' [Clostridia bacterium]|nr:primosomal protein N' [Clostridia bacterium]
MKGLVAKVALNGATYSFDKLYTYSVPTSYANLSAGSRVLVPFGKGNIKKQGMVFSVCEEEIEGLKSISSVIDSVPILNKQMLSLCEFMQKTVFCTYYDAVNAMLPTGLSYKLVNYYSANEEFQKSLLNDTQKSIYEYLIDNGEKSEDFIKTQFGVEADVLALMTENEAIIKSTDAKRKMADATQKWVGIVNDELPAKLTAKQKEVLNLLSDVGQAAVKEVCYFTGVSQSVVDGLVKKGILAYFTKQVYRKPQISARSNDNKITLTDEQQSAFEGLYNDYKSEEAKVSLLYGITGSGKTQVFLSLADKVTAEGRGVIVMVPEIALTPQLISIFTSRYGDKVAVFHSALSLGQRMDEWQRIKDGKALVAIGTRSAIFAPFDDLGLVIIDEEQEHTYKSEKTPRFHTRDLAKFRIAESKGLLCLASATPSVESFTKAKEGKYSLYKLSSRYGNAVLPEVYTVDMREELANGNKSPLSVLLYEELKETLKAKKQAILLLNRRGHNTYISCPVCSNVESCPNCNISLTYHSANNRLMCHYCGYSKINDSVCSECGSENMKFSGIGTQRAEEELKLLFPDARVLRLDADSTMTKDSYQSYLSAFANGEYDILLGTQMVAKGLDFPNVTLVGVLGADSASYSEDYRSFERTFSLLTQVVGRAGRGSVRGKAIIQTSNPDSNIIEHAKNQDYDTFYSEEILTRRLTVYPPFCDICLISSQSQNRGFAENLINNVFNNIKALIEKDYSGIKVIILGPSPSAIAKVNNRYRYRMIIKCKNNKEFREMLKKALDIKAQGDASVWVDFNPATLI